MAAYTLRNSSFDAGDLPLGGEVMKAGIISGVIGGVMMAMYGMIATTALGQGPFEVPQLIGAAFRGPEALLSGPLTIVWGVVLHVLVSAAFGMLFATLVRRDTSPGISTLAGVAYALGLFVLMTFVVANRVSMMIGTMLVMHVLFGIGVGLAPRLRRAFAAPPPPRVPRFNPSSDAAAR